MKTFVPLLALVLGCQVPQGQRQNHRASPAPENHNVALGMPESDARNEAFLIERPQYVISYNRHRNGPNWAAWRITSANYGGAKRHGHFLPDDILPTGWYQVKHEDYARSGYDRGHMVRSEDRTASDADNATTFLTSNILPQYHDLNGGPWLGLEDACRVKAQHDGRWVYVMAGGIYGASPTIIGHGVAVPEEFWKVAVVLPPNSTAADVTADTLVMAAVMPNREGIAHEKWTTYRVSLGEVERRSGWRLLGAVASSVYTALLDRSPGRL